MREQWCVKIASGVFHTHSKIADARLESLAVASIIAGEDRKDIIKVLNSNTTDEALVYLKKKETLKILVEKIKSKCEERARGEINFEISIFGFSQGHLQSTDNFRKKKDKREREKAVMRWKGWKLDW